MTNDADNEGRSSDELKLRELPHHRSFPLSHHLTYLADIFLSIRENPRSTFGCGDAALSRSRKPQRWLREIRRRHLFNQLDDSVLPFASDLLQIRIVLIEPHSRIRQQ